MGYTYLSLSFKVLSFDNLALEQLNIKKYVSPEDWKTHYMGDDGSFTMYIDLVKEEFAKNIFQTGVLSHDDRPLQPKI